LDAQALAPRLSLLVQSVDSQPDAVVLEDLRTGRREHFDSLQALATRWLLAPSDRPGHARQDPPTPL
jgi:hypothetical protein